jgi:hypothetical protein
VGTCEVGVDSVEPPLERECFACVCYCVALTAVRLASLRELGGNTTVRRVLPLKTWKHLGSHVRLEASHVRMETSHCGPVCSVVHNDSSRWTGSFNATRPPPLRRSTGPPCSMSPTRRRSHRLFTHCGHATGSLTPTTTPCPCQ